uniref:Uncharacterized protein n=1 Tax=Picea sitchensis TaxID=3332 RepID=A9NLW7_PICSI|nr:unknown [Picea sitchensis]
MAVSKLSGLPPVNPPVILFSRATCQENNCNEEVERATCERQLQYKPHYLSAQRSVLHLGSLQDATNEHELLNFHVYRTM